MTNTERIAKGLFGWEPDNSKNLSPENYREYSTLNARGYRCAASVKIATGEEHFEDRHWPDLTDWNWIRRMEDALAGKSYGLWAHYLDEVEKEFRKSEESCNLKSGVRTAIARATPEQRVAAAIAVLDHVEAEAKKQEGQ